MSITDSSARFFVFNDTATTEIYSLSLHDALPICEPMLGLPTFLSSFIARELYGQAQRAPARRRPPRAGDPRPDRKSTRLNSSHVEISYAVFCLKKKNAHCAPLTATSSAPPPESAA